MILEEITKHIHFKPEGLITNLFILSSDSYNTVIKFSVKVNQYHDSWFIIPCLDPIKVFGGIAAIDFCPLSILNKTEEEIITLVNGWTEEDLLSMAEKSISINGSSEYFKYTQ